MGSSTSSDHLSRLAGIVEAALAERVGALIGSDPDLEPFARALRHPLEAGGKRLRPVLLLATVEAIGGDLEPALSSACALELIHTFSLVHDDLPALDDDDLRRGRPTTHVAFGEDVAILVGDGLFALAFRLIAEDPRPDPAARLAAVAELARATDGMVRGQYLDLHPVPDPDAASVARMCGLKTGCLIEAGVGMGLALAGPTAIEEVGQEVYRELSRELGVGFQIVDDVLDATGTSAELGKTAGADVANDRRTFVTVLGLDAARERAAASQARAEALLDALPGAPAALREVAALIYRRTS
ncbi:MAG: polyprenyl synthetase family protein [Gaiellales bacterium]